MGYYSASADEWLHRFLFQILALVFVDVSSIRIGRAFALDCLSGYRSAPQPRKRKRIYERETVTSCMAGSMRPQHATALRGMLSTLALLHAGMQLEG